MTQIEDDDVFEEVEIRGDLAGVQARNVTFERCRLVGVRMTGAQPARIAAVPTRRDTGAAA